MPLVVALARTDPGFVILASRAEVEHVFRMKRNGLRDRGVRNFDATIHGLQFSSSDRFVVGVDWRYTGADGELVAVTSARYYLEEVCGEPSIQMIEFESYAFAAIDSWFRQVGLPERRPPDQLVH